MTHEVTPAHLSYSQIGEYAERIGRAHGVYDAERQVGYADIDRLIDILGGDVDVSETTESMRVFGKGEFVIHLPPFTSARRDRFTKAHELGHYFLHYRLPKKQGTVAFNRGGRNLVETQANVFAASLLMPAKEFKLVWSQLGEDSLKVAKHFAVSPAAAGVRAQVLRLA